MNRLLPYSLNSSYLSNGSVKATINAMLTTINRYTSGMGFGYSATNGANNVAIRAKKLQMPIDVARFRKGKILSSVNEARYVTWNRIFTAIFVNMTNIGMIIPRWNSLSSLVPGRCGLCYCDTNAIKSGCMAPVSNSNIIKAPNMVNAIDVMKAFLVYRNT